MALHNANVTGAVFRACSSMRMSDVLIPREVEDHIAAQVIACRPESDARMYELIQDALSAAREVLVNGSDYRQRADAKADVTAALRAFVTQATSAHSTEATA
ncbi:hypothetical protein FJZ28_00805 [Candidatus Peregrinibacteria bacterium]|nr:hypothetical protein [Candidatus Peregrinibacteria bacterium]